MKVASVLKLDRKRLVYVGSLSFVYLALSLVTLTLIVRGQGIDNHSGHRFDDMINGEAHRPFVNRALLPQTVRFIVYSWDQFVGAVPVLANSHFVQNEGNEIHRKTRPTGLGDSQAFEYSITFVLMVGWLVGFGWALRFLVKEFYPDQPIAADLLPAFSLAMLGPLMTRYSTNLYDPSSLLLSALALLAVVRWRLGMFYFLAPLLFFNKETSILFVLLLMVHGLVLKKPLGQLVLHGSCLGAIFVGAKLVLRAAFADNPGSELEFHLFDHNLPLIFDWGQLFYFVISLVFFGFFVGRGWSSKPFFLRYALAVILIPLVSMGMFFGFVDELRGYYEAYAILMLLALPTFREVLAWGRPSGESRGE